MSDDRLYRRGEEVLVRRNHGWRRARIVRPGKAIASSDQWTPYCAAFVLHIKRRNAWTMHPQPLYESEIHPDYQAEPRP